MAGSVFDAFDGIVARQKNLSSDSGEVLDAVVDRYCDAAPLIGLTMFYRGSLSRWRCQCSRSSAR